MSGRPDRPAGQRNGTLPGTGSQLLGNVKIGFLQDAFDRTRRSARTLHVRPIDRAGDVE